MIESHEERDEGDRVEVELGPVVPANRNQGSQPAATPSSTAPARQSRRASHQPRQNSRARTEVHQIAGVPMASTSWARPPLQTAWPPASGHQK